MLGLGLGGTTPSSGRAPSPRSRWAAGGSYRRTAILTPGSTASTTRPTRRTGALPMSRQLVSPTEGGRPDGYVTKTKAATSSHWRDAAGRLRAKTLPTKSRRTRSWPRWRHGLSHGTYVDPHAGRIRFGDYAPSGWPPATTERPRRPGTPLMRNHVIARWGSTHDREDRPCRTGGSTNWGQGSPRPRSPNANGCSRHLRSAVRDVHQRQPVRRCQAAARRKKDTDGQTITREQLTNQLLPAVPDRYRALVGLAGGTGLRWGEVVGLSWDCVDLDARRVSVIRVAVEIAGTVTTKAYPKSRAGRRTVPITDLEMNNQTTRDLVMPDLRGVFTTPRRRHRTPPGPESAPPWCGPACLARSSSAAFSYARPGTTRTSRRSRTSDRTGGHRPLPSGHGGLRFHDRRHRTPPGDLSGRPVKTSQRHGPREGDHHAQHLHPPVERPRRADPRSVR